MSAPFNPNVDPRYYARPAAYRCQIGTAAVGPAAPAAAALGGAQASGSIAFSAQPGANSTITVLGLPITFVASGGFSLASQTPAGLVLSAEGVPLPFQAVGPTGLQVSLGATLAATLANLLGLLRSWPDYALAPAHFSLKSNALQVLARDPGTAGNALTIAASAGSNGTASGATLSGGTALASGVDCLVPATLQPVELQSVYAMGRVTLAAGTVVLGLTDGTNVNVADWLTHASQTAVSATQGNTRLAFNNIAASSPLIVPSGLALMAWSTVAQGYDVIAPAGGAY